MKTRYLISFLWLFAFVSSSCARQNPENQNNIENQNNTKMNGYFSENHLVRDIIEHSAFEGFGNLLLPYDDNSAYLQTPISRIGSLMPYHQAVTPSDVVASLNHLVDEYQENKTIFYRFYSEEEMQNDPEKRNTGIFFYSGKPNAPFAVICPGGGFSYVGSLHEGLPLAKEISDNGLNAFVIRYRIGSEQKATQDLAAALKFINQNAKNLEVSAENYSLWGGSAGARMVGNIVYYGLENFVKNISNQPVTAVIAYTGQSHFSPNFPPTFVISANNDRIASISVVEKRVENLKNVGVKVVFERVKTAGHGFGIGTGTDAKGWMQKAIGFWRENFE